jgi:hypothetical protein
MDAAAGNKLITLSFSHDYRFTAFRRSSREADMGEGVI